MSVSVIVPLYNKGATVERALRSIASQTYRDFEVIVVDDGSSDRGPEAVRDFKGMPIRLIRQENAGPGRARNRGAAQAQGEMLAFLDADDEWLPEYLEYNVVQLRRRPGAAAAVCGYLLCPGERLTAAYWRRRGISHGPFAMSPRTSVMNALYHLAYMCPWSTVVRASVFRRMGGFFDRYRCLYGEDSYLWLKVLLNHEVFFSLAPMVRFHREDSNLSAGARSAGPRPVEPFLEEPSDIVAAAPPAMRPLARRIIRSRAGKTACMLGYWGEWREALRLLRQHMSIDFPLLPYGLPAIVCGTPVGAAFGSAVRRCVEVRGQGARRAQPEGVKEYYGSTESNRSNGRRTAQIG